MCPPPVPEVAGSSQDRAVRTRGQPVTLEEDWLEAYKKSYVKLKEKL